MLKRMIMLAVFAVSIAAPAIAEPVECGGEGQPECEPVFTCIAQCYADYEQCKRDCLWDGNTWCKEECAWSRTACNATC